LLKNCFTIFSTPEIFDFLVFPDPVSKPLDNGQVCIRYINWFFFYKVMLKDFTPRLYQETILATCNEKNTLVVLPTGMGKTAVSMLLAIQRLKNYPKSKILILAPTRPLAEQHLNTFKRYLDVDESKFVLFTGMVAPDKREELWKDAKFIFSTPQGMENDIISRKINLEEVSLIVFDEAHRATGEYAYSFIAKQYNKIAKYPRILALTASPGSDVEKIEEVCKNLHIEDVEIRTDIDPDVKPYVQEVEITWVEVELPEEFLEIKGFLEASFRSKLQEVKRKGFIKSATIQNMGKKDILGLQAALHSELSRGNKDYEMMKSVSLLAEAMKVQHALELLETQGISSLYKYLEKLQTESETTKVKAVKNLVKDLNFKSAFIKTRKLYENDIEHPKLAKLKEIIEKEIKDKSKIIIFNQYRDSALKIKSEISKIKNIKAEIFVGQMKKGETGLSQKNQKEMLDRFINEEFNVLISTSIGEEGLDIPEVDLVMFYEPIPSAIRHIQRRGRTGRQKKGKVIILLAKKTRDEGYRWSAYHKERRMHTTLNKLKGKLGLKFEKQQPTLTKYIKGDGVKIFADIREKASGTIKELLEIGADLDLKTLKVGDYVLSHRVAVEIKTVEDFVNSIIDGRLLQQIKELKINFERPLIIIEGTRDIYSVRKIFPTAIQGMLATIAISYGIPILQTKNYKETASLLHTIAKREQDETTREFSLHGDKKPLTLKEQQEYIISSLPNIGPTLSKPLLKKLGSVKKVINATEEQLKKIDLIGPKKAKKIKEVVDSKYDQ